MGRGIVALWEAGARVPALQLAVLRVDQILNPPLREVVLESIAIHSRGRGKRPLQFALGLCDDDAIGSVTLAAVPHLDVRRLVGPAVTDWLQLHGHRITGNHTDVAGGGIPDNTEFATGRINRAAGPMDRLNQTA